MDKERKMNKEEFLVVIIIIAPIVCTGFTARELQAGTCFLIILTKHNIHNYEDR